VADVNRSTAAVAYGRSSDAGEAIWFLGQLFVLKAANEDTGGAFALSEVLCAQGPAAPLHVQPNEDETFYVLEGDLTVHIDGEEITASVGSTVFIPRGTPHAFRVDSETARLLVLNTPAGHERFFRAVGEPAAARTLPPPPEGPPDMDAMARAAEDAGFRILGPPPF